MQRASRKPKSSSTEDLVEDRLALRLILTEIARTIARLAILPLQWVAARFQLGSLSRKRLTVWTAILFVIATALAIFQYALPYTWHQPYAILRAQWWLRPMEWNVDAGLPQINGNINAVLNTPDGACLWIAGDAGLLAFSADRGKNWTQLTYGPVTQEFRAPADAQPCGATKAGTPATSRLSLVPPLYGASPQSTVPQQAQQSTAQTAPVQTQEAPSASKSGSTKSPAPNASPRGFTNAESSSSSTTNAALDVFPKVVDFGSAYDSSKYAPARASVHVKNLDQKSVSLSRVTLSPSIFQIDRAQKDSCSDQLLGPGTECIVPLTFAPTSIGKFQGQLQFGSSNSAQPWVVGLLGIGEDSPPTAASPANTPSNNTAVAAQQGTAAKSYTRSSELSLKPPDLWGIADSRTA